MCSKYLLNYKAIKCVICSLVRGFWYRNPAKVLQEYEMQPKSIVVRNGKRSTSLTDKDSELTLSQAVTAFEIFLHYCCCVP